jgi:hypothetical protein
LGQGIAAVKPKLRTALGMRFISIEMILTRRSTRKQLIKIIEDPNEKKKTCGM